MAMSEPDEYRERMLNRLRQERFDLVVIGGGITGAGVFRDAALRGLRVALIEREDFASGTSSRSSKLVHGGLRYLELFNFGLVFESTHERARLMKLSRNLVRPLPFILPVFRSSRHGLAKITAGMWLYDLLASFRNYRMHRLLGRKSLLACEPALRSEGLKGGVLYYDAMTDDARLTLETVLDGIQAGGVAGSRIEATGIRVREGRLQAVEAMDRVGGRPIEIPTGCLICAAGPWTEQVLGRLDAAETGPRLRPTKGVHIVLPRELLPLSHAIVMSSPVDARVMFAIPWRGAIVIGTTDTDHTGPVADPVADRSDVEYLLASVHHYFPEVRAGVEDVIGTWAGLRPLIAPASNPGAGGGVAPSQVSREHQITVDPRGIVTVAGGKLTTYRLMAAETLEHALRFLPDAARVKTPTARRPLPYSAGLQRDQHLTDLIAEVSSRFALPRACAEHLGFAYGASALKLLEDYRQEDPDLLQPILPGFPFLRFEAMHAARSEFAWTLEDFLCRRTPLLLLNAARAADIAQDVAELMGRALGWDPARREQEVRTVRELASAHLAFKG